MTKRVTNITSMAETAEEERQARLRRYLLTMAFRTTCVVLMVFVRGPFLWVLAFSAIFLPWIAVVFANHVRQRRAGAVERPDEGAVVIYRPTVTVDDWANATTSDSSKESTS